MPLKSSNNFVNVSVGLAGLGVSPLCLRATLSLKATLSSR